MSTLAIAPGSPRAWVLAARPATLPVAVAPVAVGAAVAHAAHPESFRVGALLAALFGALLIQIGTNFANDVFDHEKGADDERRIGPPRAVASGLLSPRAVRAGMAAAFALAAAAGVYLTALAGWPIVAIGLASIASGIAYTGGPFPLGYNGLGDLFVFVFFGVVAVTGTAYVTAGYIPPLAWLASVPVGALATAVLVVNNVRDADNDVRAGKRTLVVRLGRAFGVFEYAALVAASALAVVLMVALGLAPALALIALVPMPAGVVLARRVATRRDGAALNACLANTAKLMLATSLGLALGIAAG
ncbi:MAG: 1,4-dihydroxy-2-naphthoate polyprenyltransferase [Polyangiaceae bacterium]